MAFNATQITTNAKAVTKSDDTEVAFFGFYVGTTGNVAVKTMADGPGGTAITFTAVPAGTIIPLAVCRIMSANTTASNIVGFGPT